jgi:hypothetical protein
MNIITQINQQQDIAIDALCDAVAIPRATYYRNQQGEEKNISTIAITPKNSLRDGEKQAILNLLHSERFVDKTPYQVFNTLLDEGKYHCSPRTMYRLLESQAESGERRVQRNHRDAIKPELIAVRPMKYGLGILPSFLALKNGSIFICMLFSIFIAVMLWDGLLRTANQRNLHDN